MQRELRIAYPWLGDIGSVPPEEDLNVFENCGAEVHNSSCFEEGVCMDPRNPKCGKRMKVDKVS